MMAFVVWDTIEVMHSSFSDLVIFGTFAKLGSRDVLVISVVSVPRVMLLGTAEQRTQQKLIYPG